MSQLDPMHQKVRRYSDAEERKTQGKEVPITTVKTQIIFLTINKETVGWRGRVVMTMDGVRSPGRGGDIVLQFGRGANEGI